MAEHLQKMLNFALEAQKFSYSPYSKFKVGACIYTTSNKYYIGANVENASYPLGSCAESSAISAMIMGGDNLIKEILVLGGDNTNLCPPCGGCRQKIREFSNSNTLIHLATANKIETSMLLSELLPLSFGPQNL